MPFTICNSKQYNINQVSPLYKPQARSAEETNVTTLYVTNTYTHELTYIHSVAISEFLKWQTLFPLQKIKYI